MVRHLSPESAPKSLELARILRYGRRLLAEARHFYPTAFRPVIASVLSQHAYESLDSEIERIECLLASRIWRRQQHEVRA